MIDVVQFLNLTAQQCRLSDWLIRTTFPVFIAVAMDPEQVEECSHRIMGSELPG